MPHERCNQCTTAVRWLGGRPYAAPDAPIGTLGALLTPAEALQPTPRPNRVAVALAGPLITVLAVSTALADSPLIPPW